MVRAKAGKKQSSKDASGRAAHSAGASLRRYNELALKKVLNSRSVLIRTWKLPIIHLTVKVLSFAPLFLHSQTRLEYICWDSFLYRLFYQEDLSASYERNSA